jgi:outer membrane protein TolC
VGIVLAVLAVDVSSAGVAGHFSAVEHQILRPTGPPTKSVLLNQPVSTVSANEGAALSSETANRLSGLPIVGEITYREFMREVQASNLTLAAQRYDVPIARAELVAASVRADPTLQTGYGGDVSGNRQVTTYTGSLSQVVVLGGKTSARKAAAKATLQASNALLADYLRTLRGEAADAFIDGVVDELKLERQLKVRERARQLVALNTERLGRNQISQDELMRVRIAELEAQNDLFDAESSLHEILAGLDVFMGAARPQGLIAPEGNLEGPPRAFSLQALVEKAMSRSDVVAAEDQLEEAHAQYQLARANRIPDVTIAGNYSHFTRITNPIDPAPAWDSATITLSVPIPLSNLNGGSIQAAYYQQLKDTSALQAARLQAETDVRTAYEHYALAVAETQQFGMELLHDADRVYKSHLFKLGHGSVSLLEVLDAHKALDQLYLDYYNALSRRAKGLVALEQSAGIWDIDF